jgi:hypothetical protein
MRCRYALINIGFAAFAAKMRRPRYVELTGRQAAPSQGARLAGTGAGGSEDHFWVCAAFGKHPATGGYRLLMKLGSFGRKRPFLHKQADNSGHLKESKGKGVRTFGGWYKRFSAAPYRFALNSSLARTTASSTSRYRSTRSWMTRCCGRAPVRTATSEVGNWNASFGSRTEMGWIEMMRIYSCFF